MSKQKVIQKIRKQFLEESRNIHKELEIVVFLEGLEKIAQENGLKEYAAYFRGNILWRQKDYKAAIAAHKKAIKLDNKFAFPLNGLGNVYADQKEYKAAIAEYKKAIKLDNTFAIPWNSLGRVYKKQKDYKAAIAAYKKAIKLDNKYATPWGNLGVIYEKQKDYKAAIAAYKKSIKLDNKDVSAWNNLGIAYDNLGDYKAAIAVYKKAIKLDNKLAIPWNNLGAVYADQGDYKAAIAEYKKAIKLDNKYANAYRNLGLSLVNINKYEEAEKNFQKALSLFTEDSDDYGISVAQSSLNDTRKKIESKKEYEENKKKEKLDASWIVLQDTKEIKDKAFKNQKSFLDFLTETKNKTNKENGEHYFQVLRRWNSYTPIIADNYHISKGGGYFINIGGKGIAIDPGFNFIDSFKGSGHLFNDIDVIITSHAHNDHTSDIESILALLYKYNESIKGIGSTEENTINSEIAKEKGLAIDKVPTKMVEDEFKKSKRRKEIDLYITLSVFKKFIGLFELISKTDYRIHTIENGSQLNVADNISIEIIGAKHFDIISDRDSTGMVIKYNGVAIIYTGDTGWSKEIEKQYQQIAEVYKSEYKLLVAHLGGFKEYEQYYKTGGSDYDCFYKNHLGRLGLAKINEIIKPDICFISEFGEELKGHRIEIANIFNKAFKDKTTFFLPADIGLTLNIDKRKIKAITNINADKNTVKFGFVDPKDVRCCLLRKDFSLHYYSSNGNFEGTDLIQVLGVQYEKSTK